MCCCRAGFLGVMMLACGWHAANAEYIVGIGAELDTEDGRAFSALASLGVAENTWLNGAAAHSTSRGGIGDLETVFIDGGIDHYFQPLGVRLGLGYWGDSDLLDSRDARASVYWRNERASVSVDYERRAFDLTIRADQLPESRFLEFEADGLGLAVRADLSDRVSAYLNGMSYDYSRNVSLQPSVDVVRVFAVSRLSTVNSLLDSRISGGVEFSFGERVFDVRVSSWRTAVFDDRVDSIGIGLLSPLGIASDLELRLSTDDSDIADRATLLSVFLYFYGD